MEIGARRRIQLRAELELTLKPPGSQVHKNKPRGTPPDPQELRRGL